MEELILQLRKSYAADPIIRRDLPNPEGLTAMRRMAAECEWGLMNLERVKKGLPTLPMPE